MYFKLTFFCSMKSNLLCRVFISHHLSKFICQSWFKWKKKNHNSILLKSELVFRRGKINIHIGPRAEWNIASLERILSDWQCPWAKNSLKLGMREENLTWELISESMSSSVISKITNKQWKFVTISIKKENVCSTVKRSMLLSF